MRERGLSGKRLSKRIEQLADVGVRVRYRRDDGTVTLTSTRSTPWKLGDGTHVVALVGFAGGIWIDRVTVDRSAEREEVLGG